MILYCSKDTLKYYQIPLPDAIASPQTKMLTRAVLETEKGSRMLEWGMRLFWFDGRPSVHLIHFASKLTFFLVDISLEERKWIPHYLYHFILDLYDGNPEMRKLVDRFFEEHPAVVFDRLTDKSAIASMSRMELEFLEGGDRLYRYIRDGILHCREINKEVNRKWPVCMQIQGKTECFFPAEYFEKLLKDEYPSSDPSIVRSWSDYNP